MRAYEHTIEIGRSLSECITVVHNGDEHIGNHLSDEKLQEAVVRRIAEDDKCYWITTGDACECILTTDPRFEEGKVPEWFTFQMMADPIRFQTDRYAEIYSPVADKCLASTIGNHEFTLFTHNKRDVYNELWSKVGIHDERRLGTHGFLRLKFVSSGKVFWRVAIYLHHGTAGGKTTSEILNQLEKLPLGYLADVYCLGHSHKRVISDSEVAAMDPSTGRPTLIRRAFSATGSYLFGVSDDQRGAYNERRIFYPRHRGPIEIKFYPNRKDIKLVL